MDAVAQVRSVTYYPFGVPLVDQDTELLAREAEHAREIGFNTLWLVVPWRALSPVALPEPHSDPAAWAKLDTLVRILSEQGLRIILPLGYFGRGWSPQGIPQEQIQAWILDDTVWGAFQDHVLRMVERYADHRNILWMFCTESFQGPLDLFQGIPLASESFQRYVRQKNPEIRYWNRRWGTDYPSFAAMDTVEIFAATSAGRWEDHFRWMCAVLRSRYGPLARKIHQMPNFAGRIGYHDNAMITLDWAKGDTPIPQDNPYDFISYTAYLEDRSVAEGLDQAETAYRRFRTRYPEIPLVIGEAGVPTLVRDASTQAEYLGDLARFAADRGMGLSIWMWRDFQGSSETERSMGLLTVAGAEKPVVPVLRGVWGMVDTSPTERIRAGR